MLTSAPMISLIAFLMSASAWAQTAMIDQPAEHLTRYTQNLIVQTPIDLQKLGYFREGGSFHRGTIVTYYKGERMVCDPENVERTQINGSSQCAFWYKDELNGKLAELPRGSILKITEARANKLAGLFEGDISFEVTAYLVNGQRVGSGDIECWSGIFTGKLKIRNVLHQFGQHLTPSF